MKNRIKTLNKRMSILDIFVRQNNNTLSHRDWNRYFILMNVCSTEYSKLIRIK